MDNDVEGDDPDDGDEIVEELMDGTNTRSWDDFDIAWEVVSSPLKCISFVISTTYSWRKYSAKVINFTHLFQYLPFVMQSLRSIGDISNVEAILSVFTRSSISSIDWSCFISSFGTLVCKK